jgi:N-acetyl-anhydromuramyl-L-alanine amidase AmpD
MILKVGSKGEQVKIWQEFLIGLGYDLGPSGADGYFGQLSLKATKAWQKSQSAPVTGVVSEEEFQAANRASDDLPIRFLQARNYTKGRKPGVTIDLIVIHTMEAAEKGNTAENVAAWFASPNAPQASAHYNIDHNSIVQSVRDEDTAWHAPGANHNGIGLEHAGYARQTPEDWADPYSIAMLRLSAKLTARLCNKHNIPPVKLSGKELSEGKRGICGHVHCSEAFNKGKGHWDPGPSFPWSHYISWVLEEFIKINNLGPVI